MSQYKYIILGGGTVAGYAAQALAHEGLGNGELAILSADDELCYERPPLSKGFLAGAEACSNTLINDPGFYRGHGIAFRLNCRINQADFKNKKLIDTEGEEYEYEKLLLATGSRLRRLELPGGHLEAVHYLRTLNDSVAIRESARRAKTAVIIGAGFIGMEVGSVLASRGLNVTIVNAQEQFVGGHYSEKVQDFFSRIFRKHGVEVLHRTKPVAFHGEDRVRQVELDSGEKLDADLVVIGVGVEPALELYEGTDLKLDGGIVVDEFLQTNIEEVWAAGDVVRYHDALFNKPRHVEHWDNAVTQGAHAARSMTGQREVYLHVPYFFSDFFDVSYEYWGDTEGADKVVHRGDPSSDEFSVWWLKDGRLIAAFMTRRPQVERELAPDWIINRYEPDAEKLGDDSVDLKTL